MKKRNTIKLIFDFLSIVFVVAVILKRIIPFPDWLRYLLAAIIFITLFAYVVFLIVDHRVKNKNVRNGSVELSNKPAENKTDERFPRVHNTLFFISTICLILFIPAWKGQLSIAGTIIVYAVFIVCVIIRLVLKIISHRKNSDIAD